MKIYTRTGDAGDTGLFGGGRVSKDHHRVSAYGTVDELNASMGVAVATVADGEIRERLVRIQHDLFAVGAALAQKLMKNDRVVLCFFGDGASNTGNFHESLNMAAAWQLPVVYVVENNLYGMSVPFNNISALADIADRAAAYDMPGVVVDGMDPIAVYEAVSLALARARRGEGPTLIECKTYRYSGHYVGDPLTYRTPAEATQTR